MSVASWGVSVSSVEGGGGVFKDSALLAYNAYITDCAVYKE